MLSLAAYACRAETGLGRAVAEPPSRIRAPFQRDRDRLIHATAFRRLEGKTQVFVTSEGDHFRTRLTHSLEVAQIARTIARTLGLDEDLAEAVALAHDLGHPPFGHAGETALAEATRPWGGFDHNLQTFRIVTELERRYAGFDGLNLCLETLEGIVKHHGLLDAMPAAVARHPLARAVDLGGHATLEAQVAALADDLAYCSHDLDDGIRAGLIALDEVRDVPLAAAALAAVDAAHPGLDPGRRRHETVRRLIDAMVGDVVAETRARLETACPASTEAVRRAARPMVAFSEATAAELSGLRAFLRARVYRHYRVNRMALKAARVVRELFAALTAHPDCLPDDWRQRVADPDERATAELVRDYVAGMTDRYARDEHDRLFRLGREP